ncbi:MAG: Asp-tRNA(Asn)/Glu-tRNA(Gln) amidotransferase subunit GatC [Actinomycetota bacterium]|nr:Asp-tRNA(Asn)/Glu-tRNA(Gln) amidotransferase subunit GatC [Actinomycetota bacterium]
MALSSEEVRHVAVLARLALTDDEVEALCGELSQILAYAEQVGQVATADVAPTSHPFPLANVLRADDPRPSLPVAGALAAAPHVEQGRFHVPRIVAEQP